MINYSEIDERMCIESVFEVAVLSNVEGVARDIHMAMRRAGGAGDVSWSPGEGVIKLDHVVPTFQCVMDLIRALEHPIPERISCVGAVEPEHPDDFVVWDVNVSQELQPVYVPRLSDVSIDGVHFLTEEEIRTDERSPQEVCSQGN